MIKIIEAVFGVFGILAGSFSALGACFPGPAPAWKGSRQSVPPLSCVGFAAFFICLGLMFLITAFADSFPKLLGYVLLVTAVSGWNVINVGAALNQRARFRSTYHFPHERRVGAAPGECLAWLFAVIGFYFLVVILWMALSHK